MSNHVYILQHGTSQKYKIGKASNAKRRKDLLTGNPDGLAEIRRYDVSFGSASELESLLHAKLGDRREIGIPGEEWFDLRPDDLQRADAIADYYFQHYLPATSTLIDIAPDDVTSEIVLCDRDDPTWQTYAQLNRLRAQIAALNFEKTLLEAQLKTRLGASSSLALPNPARPDDLNQAIELVTWKLSQRTDLDRQRLKAEHPNIYQAYSKTTLTRSFRVK